MGNYIPSRLNLANQHTHTLDDSSKREALKILNFQLWKIEPPNKTKNLIISTIIAKSQDIGEKIFTNLSAPGAFCPLTSLSNILVIPSDGVWGPTGDFPIFPLNQRGETTL